MPPAPPPREGSLAATLALSRGLTRAEAECRLLAAELARSQQRAPTSPPAHAPRPAATPLSSAPTERGLARSPSAGETHTPSLASALPVNPSSGTREARAPLPALTHGTAHGRAIHAELSRCEQSGAADPSGVAECMICLEDTPYEPSGRRRVLFDCCSHWVCSGCTLVLCESGFRSCPACRRDLLLREGQRVRVSWPPPRPLPAQGGSKDGGDGGAATAKGRGGGPDGAPPPTPHEQAWADFRCELHGRRGLLTRVEDEASRVELDRPIAGLEGLEVACVKVPNNALLLLSGEAGEEEEDEEEEEAEEEAQEWTGDREDEEDASSRVADERQAQELAAESAAVVTCGACGLPRPRADFSGAQLKKQKQAEGYGRCRPCVAVNRPLAAAVPPPAMPEAARACEAARALSEEAWLASDRQLNDELLLERYRDELHRYRSHREQSAELRRRALELAAAARRVAQETEAEAEGGGGEARARAGGAARADEMAARLCSLELEVAEREARARREAAEAAEADAVRAALAASEQDAQRAVLEAAEAEAAEAEADEAEAASDEDLPARPLALEAALRTDRWARGPCNGGHRRYSRWVRLGDSAQCVLQHLTMANTPSDRRAQLKQLADVRRMDNGVRELYGRERPSSDDERFHARFHELQEKRKHAAALVVAMESEINSLVDEIGVEQADEE